MSEVAPRRVGRPPRIDRDSIARAVLEVGFDNVTMRSVAAHLGVSVPGLYHYVRGKDDLLRLGAEHSIAEIHLPEDTGQHWATWLRKWARYTRTAMARRPELIEHYLAGGIDPQRMVEVVGRALDVLVREGFDHKAAVAAWDAVGSIALGSAVEDVREASAAGDGRPWISRMHGDLAQRPAEEQATLRTLLGSGYVPDRDAEFEDKVTAVLIGLAVQHGRPVDDEVTGAPDSTLARAPRRRRATRRGG
ncbi:MAG: TetR family transcriptional regulator [Actinomycetota bacterium]|nr:TetR family transcriptional regulator [Acidimicrobiia bacterium]MDQ3292841.1 TetR family transcriptional regulator [Actinomycetota bacterium]